MSVQVDTAKRYLHKATENLNRRIATLDKLHQRIEVRITYEPGVSRTPVPHLIVEVPSSDS